MVSVTGDVGTKLGQRRGKKKVGSTVQTLLYLLKLEVCDVLCIKNRIATRVKDMIDNKVLFTIVKVI